MKYIVESYSCRTVDFLDLVSILTLNFQSILFLFSLMDGSVLVYRYTTCLIYYLGLTYVATVATYNTICLHLEIPFD